MVIIIFVLIGLLIMFPKRISVSKNSELRRPKTVIFGFVLIGCFLLASYLQNIQYVGDNTSQLPALYYGLALLISLSTILFLKKPKIIETSTTQTKNTPDKIVNIATWIFVTIIGIVIVLVAINVIRG